MPDISESPLTAAGGKPQAKRRHTDNRCQTSQSSHCLDTFWLLAFDIKPGPAPAVQTIRKL